MTDSKRRETRMVEARRRVTVRDYLIFVLKLFLDGMKDGLLITVSTGAVALDMLSGGGKRPRIFYSVLRVSERFDLWLNLNGAMEKMDAGLDDDGLFGASDAGADTLLGKVEQMVRGGDEPRGERRAASSGEPEPEEAPDDEPEPEPGGTDPPVSRSRP